MSWRSKSKWIAHLETSIPIESPPLCGYVETLLLRKLTTHQSRAARLPNFLARPDFPQAAGFADAKCQAGKRLGTLFSIRMIIWIFCSDTLWWLCVFLLVQQSYFQRVRRQCCLAISSSLWHSSAYKVLARLTKSLLLRPILCRPVAMMICIQKTFGWYEFKEEMAIFLERQTDGKRANSFGLCLIALNLNSFFPFFMTKCTFFLLNSEMWNENHCFNKKVCNCLLNNFLNPSPQDIGLLFIPTQLLQHSLLNIMRRINQDLAQVGSMDQTIWLLRTLSW